MSEPTGSPRDIEDIFPLSPLQQGMLFHSVYAPETGVYFEQSCWKLNGSLDSAALERAWQKVVDRHPALRTAYLWEELGETLQIVHRRVSVPMEMLDWRSLPRVELVGRLELFL
jgi:hypothetical protein